MSGMSIGECAVPTSTDQYSHAVLEALRALQNRVCWFTITITTSPKGGPINHTLPDLVTFAHLDHETRVRERTVSQAVSLSPLCISYTKFITELTYHLLSQKIISANFL